MSRADIFRHAFKLEAEIAALRARCEAAERTVDQRCAQRDAFEARALAAERSRDEARARSERLEGALSCGKGGLRLAPPHACGKCCACRHAALLGVLREVWSCLDMTAVAMTPNVNRSIAALAAARAALADDAKETK